MGYTSVKNLIYGGCNRLYPQWWSLGGTWDDGHIGLWRVFHGWSNTSKTWSIAPRVWAGKINNFWWPISEWLPVILCQTSAPKSNGLKHILQFGGILHFWTRPQIVGYVEALSIRNKPPIRNFPGISNKESETKTRESETKIRESETKIPRIRNQKPRESETKIQESDTKPCESETENQKLKIANQTPRSANQKPNKATNQKPKKHESETKSATPSEHFVEWDITANLSP